MVTIIIILFVIAAIQRILPRFSVGRSVTTSMIFIGILLLGFISVTKLPQEFYPPITFPQLTVATTYANAAPEEIETLITKIIEEAISTVKNIKKEIHSVSKEGLSMVIADFAWGTDMNIAALNMREKIDLVKEMLPRDAEEPIVLKYNPYALPVMILSVTGTHPPEELLRISKKIIKDKLEKLEGVASAGITGGREREIRVEIDQAELKAANTDLLNVVEALKNANLNYPAGTTKEKFYEYLIRTMGEFKSVEEIREVPITLYDVEEEERKEREEERYRREREKRIIHKKRLIFLKDIARIEDTFKEPTSHSRYNGRPNISIAIQKQADANTIRTAQLVRRELERLKETTLPKGVNIEIVKDQSTFIRNSIRGVADAAWQGGILVFIVLFVFLRKFLNSFIVAVSIPISIFATFSLMYFQGFSINMISLGGLALGVGMLVDNSIVVIENISRYQELGTSKKDAAVNGATQVSGAVVASTLTTVAVFLPMVFLYGLLGQVLKAFSFTICFSLTASLFVGLSLIPMLSSRGKKEVAVTSTKRRFDFIPFLIRLDERILSVFMKHKFLGLGIAFVVFLGAIGLFLNIDRELMPKVDKGEFTLKISLSTGTRLEVTNETAERIENHLLDQPDVYSVTTRIGSERRSAIEAAYETLGSHQGQIDVKLKRDRTLSTQHFVQTLKEAIDDMHLTSARVDYLMEESMFAATGAEVAAPIVVKLHGTDLRELDELAMEVAKRITPIKGLYGIKTTIASPSPETRIVVDKDRASLYSVNVRDIAQSALISIKGLTATKLKEEGNEYDITVRLDPKYRKDITSLKGIQIYSPQGFAVPLDELATLKRGRGPSEVNRYEQQRVIFVSANLFGESLQAVSEKVNSILAEIEHPEGYIIKLIGETEEAKEAIGNLLFIIALAFTLVYMIMASQFESTWQPFVIMFTVPFSIIGVCLILVISGISLNGMVMIGILLLGGVVVNNGIVLIDYLNQMLAEGKPLLFSAIEASKIRLRPIIMTALTTVLGFTPLALNPSEGAEILSPLAITVIGGLIFATVLTLWIIPVLYVIVAGLLQKVKKR